MNGLDGSVDITSHVGQARLHVNQLHAQSTTLCRALNGSVALTVDPEVLFDTCYSTLFNCVSVEIRY